MALQFDNTQNDSSHGVLSTGRLVRPDSEDPVVARESNAAAVNMLSESWYKQEKL